MVLHYLCRSPVLRYNTPKNLHLEQTLLWFHLELHVNQNTWWLLQKMTELCCLEMSWKICLKIVQTCSIVGGNLVLLQVATCFTTGGNIVLPQGKLVFLQGATLFYYRGQTYFKTGGNLALLQEANSFYYRGQTYSTTGGNLVLLQGTNLFYHRGQTCFTTGVNLAKVVEGGGGGENCINLHKPFDLILLDLQLTMDMITIKSYAS